MKIGSNYLENEKCEFSVWAPAVENLKLKIISPEEKIFPLKKDEKDYWKITLDNIKPGTKYFFRINSDDRPDPASQFQPDGVHGPSQIIDHASFQWKEDNWKGIPLKNYIIYEIHTGTFTGEGTFESAIEKLDELVDLGITAVEVMPVAQFPGKRNWGYDGVYLFAPQNSYGGPEGFKKFVQACHQKNLAVILDVVYNHFGPEGNYNSQYGYYLNHNYITPWGDAINYDAAYSDEVRNYVIENVIHWIRNYHIDALRLDAVHSIYDMGAKHLLAELSEITDKLSEEDERKYYLIAESDLNDVKIIRPLQDNGYGCDAQWSDDFHHSVHAFLTGEKEGYYSDFGKLEHLVTALNNSFVYSGIYSKHRKRKHGNKAAEMSPEKFVIAIQNHDQVGNRAFGERLNHLVDFNSYKLAAGVMLLSPYIPLLFMGEEYAEDAPFLYFVNHGDPSLVEAVRKGRKEEFSSFNWEGEIPDPQSEDTFNKSKLNWELREKNQHKKLLGFYKKLISIRKNHPALSDYSRANLDVTGNENDRTLIIKRWKNKNKIAAFFNFNNSETALNNTLQEKKWQKIFDSSDQKWEGTGDNAPDTIKDKINLSGLSFAIYETEE